MSTVVEVLLKGQRTGVFSKDIRNTEGDGRWVCQSKIGGEVQ